MYYSYDFGDFARITDIFNIRHSKTDAKTVTKSYVRKVLLGIKPVSPNTASEEITNIARHYITTKNKCKEELIAA